MANKSKDTVNAIKDIRTKAYTDIVNKQTSANNAYSSAVKTAGADAKKRVDAYKTKAEDRKKKTAQKAKKEYDNYVYDKTTQTAQLVGFNAYANRTTAADRSLNDGIRTSLLAYGKLKADGELAAAEREKKNAENLIAIQKQAYESSRDLGDFEIDSDMSERKFAEQQKQNAISNSNKERQRTISANSSSITQDDDFYIDDDGNTQNINAADNRYTLKEKQLGNVGTVSQKSTEQIAAEKSYASNVNDIYAEKAWRRANQEPNSEVYDYPKTPPKSRDELKKIVDAEIESAKITDAKASASKGDDVKAEKAWRKADSSAVKPIESYYEKYKRYDGKTIYANGMTDAQYNVAINPTYSPLINTTTVSMWKKASADINLPLPEKIAVMNNLGKSVSNIDSKIIKDGFTENDADVYKKAYKSLGFSDADASGLMQVAQYKSVLNLISLDKTSMEELRGLFKNIGDNPSEDETNAQKNLQAKYSKVKLDYLRSVYNKRIINSTEADRASFTDEEKEIYKSYKDMASGYLKDKYTQQTYLTLLSPEATGLSGEALATVKNGPDYQDIHRPLSEIVTEAYNSEWYAKKKAESDKAAAEKEAYYQQDFMTRFVTDSINAVTGAAESAMSSLYRTLDFVILVDEITTIATGHKWTSIFESNADYLDSLSQQDTEKFLDAAYYNFGTPGVIVGQMAVSTLASIPMMLTSIASAGAGTPVAMSTLGGVNVSASTAKIIGNGIRQLITTPSFWSSVAFTLGPTYKECIDEGASPLEASVVAYISTFAGAIIEIGGGLEGGKTLKIPSKLNDILKFIRECGEEGLEEVLQALTQTITQGSIYDSSKFAGIATEDYIVELAMNYAGGAFGAFTTKAAVSFGGKAFQAAYGKSHAQQIQRIIEENNFKNNLEAFIATSVIVSNTTRGITSTEKQISSFIKIMNEKGEYGLTFKELYEKATKTTLPDSEEGIRNLLSQDKETSNAYALPAYESNTEALPANTETAYALPPHAENAYGDNVQQPATETAVNTAEQGAYAPDVATQEVSTDNPTAQAYATNTEKQTKNYVPSPVSENASDDIRTEQALQDVNDFVADVNTTTKYNSKSTTVKSETGSLTYNAVSINSVKDKQTANEMNAVKKTAEYFDNKVVFYTGQININGKTVNSNGFNLNGKLYVNLDNGKALQWVIGHEIAHNVFRVAADKKASAGMKSAQAAFTSEIVTYAYNGDNDAYNTDMAKKVDELKSSGAYSNLSDEQITAKAQEEVFCDHIGNFFEKTSDLKTLKADIESNPTKWQEFLKVLSDIIARIKARIKDIGTGGHYNAETEKLLQNMEKARQNIARLLREYKLNAKKTSTNGEVNFSTKNTSSKANNTTDTEDDKYLELAKEPKANKVKLQEMVDTAAKKNKYVTAGYHGTTSGGFTKFDRHYANVEANSGAGFYFSSSNRDSEDNYSNIEGADNFFKASSLAENIIDMGEWDGKPISDYDEALKIAKKELNKKPEIYNVYLNLGNSYIRDFRNSTNLFDDVMDGYVSNIERSDYDDEDSYDDDVFAERSDYIYGRIYEAVYDAVNELESNYEVIGDTTVNDIASALSETAYDYDSLTWNDISDILDNKFDGVYELVLDNKQETSEASRELTRLIVKDFGYDSITDKEVSTKFNQLIRSGEEATHYIVFEPEQIKSSEPVTYDDNGNVIPLEERFNDKKDDIRFSVGKTTETEARKYLDRAEAANGNGDVNFSVGNRKTEAKSADTRTDIAKALTTYAKTDDAYKTIADEYEKAFEQYKKSLDTLENKRDKLERLEDQYAEKAQLPDKIKERIKGLNREVKKATKEAVEAERTLFALEKQSLVKEVVSEMQIDSPKQTKQEKVKEAKDNVTAEKQAAVATEKQKGKEAVKEATRQDLTVNEMSDLIKQREKLFDALTKSDLDVSEIADVSEYGKLIKAWKKSILAYDKAYNIWDNYKQTGETDDGVSNRDYSKILRVLSKEVEKASERMNYYNTKLAKTEGTRLFTAMRKKVEMQKPKAYTNKTGRKIATLKAKNTETVDRIKANKVEQKRKYLRSKIKKNCEVLYKFLMSPDVKNGKYIHHDLQTKVYSFLTALSDDNQADPQKWVKKLSSVQKAVEELKSEGRMSDAEFTPILQRSIDAIVKEMDEVSVSDLSLTQLQKLSEVVSMLISEIKNANTLIGSRNKASVAVTANKGIGHLKKNKIAKSNGKLADTVKDNLAYDNILPIDAFARLGDAGIELFEELSAAQDQYLALTRRIDEFTSELEDEYKSVINDIRSGKGTTIKFSIGGETVGIKFDIGELMAIYLTGKREAGKGHIIGEKAGGIKLSQERLTKAMKDKDNNADDIRKIIERGTFSLTEEEYNSACEKLSDNEKAFADKISLFMSEEVAGWGNETTLTRWGVASFVEKFYIPLKSASVFLKGEESDGSQKDFGSRYAIDNLSFTKALTPKANNPVVLADLFSTFIDHSFNMAMYAAYSIPINDLNKVLDYQSKDIVNEKTEITSFRNEVVTRLGKGQIDYIETLIKDLSKTRKAESTANLLNKLLTRSKAAAVAGNLSVVVQQYFAITKAAYTIALKYLGISQVKNLNPIEIKNNIKEGIEHNPLFWWKSKGYFETDVAAPMEERLNRRQKTVGEKVDNAITNIQDVAMKPAGWMDNLAWGVIWGAAKQKVEAENKGITKGSDEYWAKVNKIFNETIYHTQVVDTTLTRTQASRSKDTAVKMLASFMNEPMSAYSMVANNAYMLAKTTDKADKAMYKKQLAKSGVVCISTQAVNAIVVGLIAGLRDKDKDKDYLERVGVNALAEFLPDLLFFGNTPYGNAVISIFQGYTNRNLALDGVNKVYSTFTEVKSMFDKLLSGEDIDSNDVYSTVYAAAQMLSYITGVPIGNILRDVYSVGNEISNGISGTTWGISNTKYISTHTQDMYDAYASGDTAKYEKEKAIVKKLMMGGGRTEQQAEQDIQSRIKTLMKEDKNIIEAAQLIQSGNAYAAQDIIVAMQGKGFDEQDINEAVEAVLSSYKSSVKSVATYIASGEDAQAEKTIQSLIRQGFDESHIREDVEAEKEQAQIDFLANTEEVQKAVVQMINGDKSAAGKAINALAAQGYESAAITKAVSKVESAYKSKIKEAAELYLSERTAEGDAVINSLVESGYNRSVVDVSLAKAKESVKEEAAYKYSESFKVGVSEGTVANASHFLANVTTEEVSKREQVRDYVLKLPLSDAQKQVLYDDMLGRTESQNNGDIVQYGKAEKALSSYKLYNELAEEDKKVVLDDVSRYYTDDTPPANKSYAVTAGLDLAQFAAIEKKTSREVADKDGNGKTISGSKKKKVIADINNTGWSGEKKAFYFLYTQSASKADLAKYGKRVSNYIAKLSISSAEKKVLLAKCKLLDVSDKERNQILEKAGF